MTEKEALLAFLGWIEAVGQTGGGTKRCQKVVGSHDGSRVRGQAWSTEIQAWVSQVRGKRRM
ncbi:hypothetical protein Gotur_030098 [Gossypium turneri]